MKKLFIYIMIIILLASLVISGCSKKKDTNEDSQHVGKIRIAQQFGLVYAPLMMADEKGFFEKYGLEVEWKRFGSGGAAREAITAGEVDVAFMGIPPFLLGWDRGVPAKIASGYVVSPVSLVTYKEEIMNLEDITKEHRIALPSPGSVQHILLSMAAERELNDPNAFDDQLVALPHPDGAAAMLAKQDIDAHFTTPPYLFRLLKEDGYSELLTGEDAFGKRFSFNVCMVAEEYYEKNPIGYAGFIMGLNDAMAWMNENKEEAAMALASEFNMGQEELYEYLTWQGLDYTTSLYGLPRFIDYMNAAGYIDRFPENMQDIVFDNVAGISRISF